MNTDDLKNKIAELADSQAEQINKKLSEYISRTEIPIFAEFCAEIDSHEEFVLKLAKPGSMLMLTIKTLENKKRAALERKIYSQQLNATIGAHLLKRWNETPASEILIPEFRKITSEDFEKLELQEDEAETIDNFIKTLDIRIPAESKIKRLSRTYAQEIERGIREC